MRAYKIIVMIVLIMAIFTLFINPMEVGTFPAWMNTDMIQFMLVLMCVVCVLVLMG